jgi:hypothetical protein
MQWHRSDGRWYSMSALRLPCWPALAQLSQTQVCCECGIRHYHLFSEVLLIPDPDAFVIDLLARA